MGCRLQSRRHAAGSRAGATCGGVRVASRQCAAGRELRRRGWCHRHIHGVARGEGARPAASDARALCPAGGGKCLVWWPLLFRIASAVRPVDARRPCQQASADGRKPRGQYGEGRCRHDADHRGAASGRSGALSLLDGIAYRPAFAATFVTRASSAAARPHIRVPCHGGCATTRCSRWRNC
jgi:hypothetical protein